MNNLPEIIDYAYAYVHSNFAAVMSNKYSSFYDEIRNAGEEHKYFDSNYHLDVIEMPLRLYQIKEFEMLLKQAGIPFFTESVLTEEYSMYQAFLTNKECIETSFNWTSMNTEKDTKVTKIDPKFFSEFSILRASHLSLIPDMSLEDSLNAYYSNS